MRRRLVGRNKERERERERERGVENKRGRRQEIISRTKTCCYCCYGGTAPRSGQRDSNERRLQMFFLRESVERRGVEARFLSSPGRSLARSLTHSRAPRPRLPEYVRIVSGITVQQHTLDLF